MASWDNSRDRMLPPHAACDPPPASVHPHGPMYCIHPMGEREAQEKLYRHMRGAYDGTAARQQVPRGDRRGTWAGKRRVDVKVWQGRHRHVRYEHMGELPLIQAVVREEPGA